jgi:hypothetical protein
MASRPIRLSVDERLLDELDATADAACAMALAAIDG